MSFIAATTRSVEQAPLPYALSKLRAAALVDRAGRSLSTRPGRAATGLSGPANGEERAVGQYRSHPT